MITRAEIAKLAGVSTTTVTRVLSGKGYVSKKNYEKITEIIEKNNYIPNAMARSLNNKSNKIIAVLVEDLTNQYYYEIIDAMSKEAYREGAIVSVFSIDKDNIDSIVENLISNRVCGIVNLSLQLCKKKHIEILQDMGTYLVNIENGNVLDLNYETGIKELFEYLSEKGKKSLAFFAGLGKEKAEVDLRYSSYKKFVKEYGFKDNENLIVFGDYPESDIMEEGKKAVREFLKSGIKADAILCLNDAMAFGVLSELAEKGIRVPDDISVIGCDNIFMAKFTYPGLATLDIDKRSQGETFVKEALKGKSGDAVYYFDTKLIKRGSLA